MSAPAASSSSVHVEIPGLLALSERGHWGACGLIAEATAYHVCSTWATLPLVDRAATDTLIATWINEYHAAINPANGQPRASATGITTLGNIYWHLALHKAHLAGYIPYSDTPDLAALHTFVRNQAVLGNPVIIEVGNAAALPHNEQGIQYHFVCLGGIDSVQGYLVANGDTTDALTTTALTVPCYWATWQQLVNAKICGAIALDRTWKPAPPPPAPPPPVVPIGLADAIAQAETLVAALKAMQTPAGG